MYRLIAAIACISLLVGAEGSLADQHDKHDKHHGHHGERVKIVASTTDLASIAKIVGGDLVDVTSIAKGKSDPHYVEVLPSYMIKVKRADVYLKVGLDLDRWAQKIIDGSRNDAVVVVDCSARIQPLNVPTQKVDASMGDVHPQGNPHYWLDPANGLIVAEMIVEALITVDGDNSSHYESGLASFRSKLDAKRSEWGQTAVALRGLEIVTYHDSWPYFSNAFGLEVVGFVQPKPGIEPTPSHTAKIVDLVKARGVRVIGIEPYFSRRAPETIARASQARVVGLPPSVGGAEGADDYFSLFDTLISTLTAAAQGAAP
jgi:ABC-type Zn uptake system ZnuABC Zn-binding protein ZnuA